MEFAGFGAGVLVVELVETEHEDHVRPGGVLIHVGGTGDSIFLSQVNQLKNLGLFPHIHFSEVLNIRPELIFPDLEITLTHIKQVPDLFHVQFKYGNLEFVLNGLGGLVNG